VLAAAYALSAGGCCALAAYGRAGLVDLHVYRAGGDAVLHGAKLYQQHFAGLPFTYPPFAAVIFTVLAALPWTAAAGLITAASAAALPASLWFALRLPPASSWLDSRAAWRLALAAAIAAIWLEPVRSTLGYGQVNLLLAAGVLYDLWLPAGARRKGTVIGLAAGVKLVPAFFLVYLLVTRRYRAAATGAAVLAATVAAGWAVLPASSAHYWAHSFLDSGRISPVQNPYNQSLLGVIARNLHSPAVRPVWLPAAAVIAAIGLALAARAQRGGSEAAGFSLCAITGLLISPISWTHHWVIAIPALLLAAVATARRAGPGTRPATVAAAAGLAVLAIAGWARLAREVPAASWLHQSSLGLLLSEIYVLAGLGVLAGAAARAAAGRPGHRAAARPAHSE